MLTEVVVGSNGLAPGLRGASQEVVSDELFTVHRVEFVATGSVADGLGQIARWCLPPHPSTVFVSGTLC